MSGTGGKPGAQDDVEVEDAITVAEYSAKFKREESVEVRRSGPSKEQVLAIERYGTPVGLRVDVSAVR